MMSARALTRFAVAGLVAVLLSLSAFAFWSSRLTSTSARHAVHASAMTDHYEQALTSLVSEQSAVATYRTEGGASGRRRYDAAAQDLVSAMLAAGGSTSDRPTSVRMLGLHGAEVDATHRYFAAIDAHRLAAALRIFEAEVEPRFADLARVSTAAADAYRQRSLAAVHQLRDRIAFTSAVRPVVFAVGMLVMLVLALVLHRIRRALYFQREQAVRESLHDPLTGLANRALLAERFEQALRPDGSGSGLTGLLLLDLDRFKEVNDTLGHHFGDQLLTQVGPRLKEALRDGDTVARLGGDEFAVLLPGIDGLDDALLVAEKLRYALTSPFTVDGLELDVEASIGVVVSGDHGDDASTLLQHADIAMYVAKKQSIGVFPYDPDADGHTPQKLTLLGDLRRALERDELVLHYQPKIDLATGEVSGVEGLVRWQHPHHGLLSPGEFIPLAERTGLIAPLADYVLDAALSQSRRWADTGLEVPIAVNLSARNLLDVHLVDKIGGLLAQHARPASALEVEVTESALMTDPVRAQETVLQLRALGIRVAIDDFGVGYTNLSQLKTLPITDLKIDQSFVTTMTADPHNQHIVKSIIELSRNLGITTVAEGIESEAILIALRRAGCDTGQGYHICRPVPPDALARWIAARRSRRQRLGVRPIERSWR